MKRYLETFFRYWFIALLPVIVLPAAAYAVMGHPAPTYVVSTNLWVDQAPADNNALAWQSAADSEGQDFKQSLQTPMFDTAVVSKIPSYQQMFRADANPLADLTKNVAITSLGPHILHIEYTTVDISLGLAVVHRIVAQQKILDAQTSTYRQTISTQSAQRQLHSAQAALRKATKEYNDYVAYRHYSTFDVPALLNSDSTLASLTNQVQNAQQAQKAAVGTLAQAKAAQVSSQAAVQQDSTFYSYGGDSYYRLSTKKKVVEILAIALIAGLALGGVFVITKTFLDRTIRLADEVPALLGLPVLTVLPYSPALATQRIGTPRAVATISRLSLPGGR